VLLSESLQAFDTIWRWALTVWLGDGLRQRLAVSGGNDEDRMSRRGYLDGLAGVSFRIGLPGERRRQCPNP